jgi:hypothetical protein
MINVPPQNSSSNHESPFHPEEVSEKVHHQLGSTWIGVIFSNFNVIRNTLDQPDSKFEEGDTGHCRFVHHPI